METKTTQVLIQKEFDFENFSHSRSQTKNKFDENHLFKIISDGILHVCLNTDIKFINLSESEARWYVTKALETELQSEFEDFVSTYEKTRSFSIVLNYLKEKLHLQEQNPILLIKRELNLSLDLVFQGYEDRRYFAKNLLAGCHDNHLNGFKEWSSFKRFKQVKPVHVDFNPIAVSILLKEVDYELISQDSAGVTIGHADLPCELKSRLILISLLDVYDFDELKKTKLHEYTHAIQSIYAQNPPSYMTYYDFSQKLKAQNQVLNLTHCQEFTKNEFLFSKYKIIKECCAYASEGQKYITVGSLGLSYLTSQILYNFEQISDEIKNTEIKSTLFSVFHEYIKSTLNFGSKMCLLTRTEFSNQDRLTVKHSRIFSEIMLSPAEDYGYELLRNKQGYVDDQELLAHAKREGIQAFNKYLEAFNKSLSRSPSEKSLTLDAAKELDLAIIHAPLSQIQIDHALQILSGKPASANRYYIAKYLKQELLHAKPKEFLLLNNQINQILESINLEYSICKDSSLRELIEAQELVQSVITGKTAIERFLNNLEDVNSITKFHFHKFLIYMYQSGSTKFYQLKDSEFWQSNLLKSDYNNLILILRSNANYEEKIFSLNALSNLIKINNYDLKNLLEIKRGVEGHTCSTYTSFQKLAYSEALNCYELTLKEAFKTASFKIT